MFFQKWLMCGLRNLSSTLAIKLRNVSASILYGIAEAISSCIKSEIYFPIIGSSIACCTVSIPARKAIPQLRVCVPFSNRNFNSRYKSISGSMTMPSSASANETIFLVRSLPSMAHNLYTSHTASKSSV